MAKFVAILGALSLLGFGFAAERKPTGETFNMYGTNLPDLIRRKVALMEKHRNDEPRIDPDFMWRLPPDSGLDPKAYINPFDSPV